MRFFSLASILTAALFTAGCGSSNNENTGTLSLGITDAPIDDAYSVVVQFSEVRVRGAGAGQNLTFTFDPAKSIDLLTLQGTQTEALFTDETVPAGVYNEIRLIINAVEGTEDTYIVLEEGGAQHDMTVPSGSQSGLKVKGPVTVTADESASFTIDFDVRKSIVKTGNGKYHLKPVLRIVDNSEDGVITGIVDPELLTQAAGCSDDDPTSNNAVYVFEGLGVTADDINTSVDNTTVEPVVTALVEYDSVSDTHRYEAAFLVAGDYTVSFTCNADAENIEEDNDLQFVGTQDAPVEVGETRVVNFLPPLI